MQCPYCGEEMTAGLIQAYSQSRALKWFSNEDKKKDSFASWFRGANGMPIGKADILYGARVECCYCEHCRKMVIDLDQK